MYNIKIINTSNNTRIILTESFRRPVALANLGVWSGNQAHITVDAPPFPQTFGLGPGIGPSAPRLGDHADVVGGAVPWAAKLTRSHGGGAQRGPATSGKTSNYNLRGLTPNGSGQTVYSSKFLFQLTSGQLGFKGATRKSSFVVSKLIQQFFNFIKSRSDNFRNIQFNIYFVGINPKDGVIMDQIRLALPKLIGPATGHGRGDEGAPNRGETGPTAGRGTGGFRSPTAPGGFPTTSGGLRPVSRRIMQNFQLAPLQAGRGKFYDITPIPFNGCKLKKSRRK